VVAIGLALGPLAGLAYKFQTISPEELVPGADWPPVSLASGSAPVGPVMVTVEYVALPGREDELIAALEDARFSRRRTGASSWRAWRDSAQPDRILEQFIVASWDEHLRQRERVTERDQRRLDAIRAITGPGRPPTVTHWLAAKPVRHQAT
jgi:Transmembrane secretion effector